MTNYEKYKDQINKVWADGNSFAVKKNKNSEIEILPEDNANCNDCLFRNEECFGSKRKWLVSEYKEPGNVVDWTKVPVDTPILVRDSPDKFWNRGYFAKYENGKVYAFSNGGTSWSCGFYFCEDWKFARLANEDELVGNEVKVENKELSKDELFDRLEKLVKKEGSGALIYDLAYKSTMKKIDRFLTNPNLDNDTKVKVRQAMMQVLSLVDNK